MGKIEDAAAKMIEDTAQNVHRLGVAEVWDLSPEEAAKVKAETEAFTLKEKAAVLNLLSEVADSVRGSAKS